MTDKIIHLLASDYDGTIRRGQTVSEEDIKAIAEWQAAGNLFVICTGRPLISILDEMKLYGIQPDYFALCNGAAAASYDQTYLFQHFLPEGSNQKLYKLGHSLGGKHFVASSKEGHNLHYKVDHPETSHITLEEFLAMKHLTQVNLAFREDLEKAILAAKLVTEQMPEISVHRNHGNVDCNPRGFDKGTGVAEMAALFGISADRCHTVGDGMNDAPMVIRFKGAAIEDGEKELKEKAALVVPSVAAYIKHLMKNS